LSNLAPFFHLLGCSVPPSQKDLFLDTPDEGGSQQNKESSKIVCSDDLFSAAEDSVRVLEDDCQEAGKVLEELQSDWSTQQTNKNLAGIKKVHSFISFIFSFACLHLVSSLDLREAQETGGQAVSRKKRSEGD
jgi:hypothetical protein